MIVLDEKIVGIWYLSCSSALMRPNSAQDWMAAIRELVPDEKYELTYRFRYYMDKKAFDSEDRKNWYQATLSATRNYVIGSIRSVAKTLAAAGDGELFELINDRGVEQFMRDFQDQPFVWVKVQGKI